MKNINYNTQRLLTAFNHLDHDLPVSTLFDAALTSTATDCPASMLPFCPRARVAFQSLEIGTVAQLLRTPLRTLHEVKDFGYRSLFHTLEVLDQHLAAEAVMSSADGRLAPASPDDVRCVDTPSQDTPSQDADRNAAMPLPVSPSPALSSESLSTEASESIYRLDWSQPIHCMLPLEQSYEDANSVSISCLGLNTKALSALSRIGVSSVDQVMSVSLFQLMKLRNTGARTVWHILQCIHHHDQYGHARRSTLNPDRIGVLTRLCHVSEANTSRSPRKKEEVHENYASLLALDEAAQTIIFDAIVAHASNPVLELLTVLGLDNLTRLLTVNAQDSKSENTRSLVAFVRTKLNPLVTLAADLVAEHGGFPGHEQFLLHLSQSRTRQPLHDIPRLDMGGEISLRIATILSARPVLSQTAHWWLCSMSEQMTLQKIGDRLGVSRERARQLANATLKRLEAHPGFLEWACLEARRHIETHGGIVGMDELEDCLLDRERGNHLPIQPRLIEFLSRSVWWRLMGLTRKGANACIHTLSERTLDALRQHLIPAARRCSVDIHGPKIWVCPAAELLKELSAIVTPDVPGTPKTQPAPRISAAAFKLIVDHLSDAVRLDGHLLYSLPYWLLRFGTRTQQVETILLVSEQPMRRSDILSHVNHWSSQERRHSIYDVLRLSGNVSNLGNGTYTHRTHLSFE